MARKPIYRPTCLDGLEARVALSHLGMMSVIVRSLHHGGIPHGAGAHHGVKAHHGASPSGGGGANKSINLLSVSLPGTSHAPPAVPNVVPTPPPVVTLPVTPAPIQGPPATTPPIGVPPVSLTETAEEQTIVDLTNQQRAQAGLPPLQINVKLVEAAHIEADQMVQLGQMAHVLPGAALPTPESRFQYVGYNASWLGENVAFNFADANAVVTGWMNSPEHRANILNPNYTEIGVGVAFDSQGEPYYSQDFGQPM